MKTGIVLGVVASTLFSVSMVGCTDENASDAPSLGSGDTEYVYDVIKSRNEAVSQASPLFKTVADLLPNTKYSAPGITPKPLTDLTLIGDTLKVQPGKGFYANDEFVDGLVTEFEDPRVEWRTVHATVIVEEVLGEWGSVPETVTVGFAIGPDIDVDRFSTGLEKMGSTVFFLYKSPVFAYNDSVYGVIRDGDMLAPIVEGRLTLPALSEIDADLYLADGGTVTDLKAAAAEPEVVVEVKDPGEALSND